MRSATIQEIKQELAPLSNKELIAICLRLGRFKKENKELLTYLLFDAHNEAGYIQEVKDEMDLMFEEINRSHFYFVKKSLRKILRFVSKHSRYTASKTAEVEWLLHFCERFKEMGIPYEQSPVLVNLYNGQLKKLHAAIHTLHEDLQYEFRRRADNVQM